MAKFKDGVFADELILMTFKDYNLTNVIFQNYFEPQ